MFAVLASACGGVDASLQDEVESTPSVETASPTTLSSGEPTETESSTTSAEPTTTQPATTTTTTAPTTTEQTTTTAAQSPVACVATPGASTLTLDASGVMHDVRVFVPEGLANDAVVPVVLNFHGFAQSGSEQATFSNYEQLAAQEGFIVVHPTAVPPPGGSDNAWELLEQDFVDRDDAAMVEVLINAVVENYCGDRSKIYATGFSNGGYFTSRLVCELSDTIAGAVSVGALTHPDNCEPTRPVPYMAFHGTNDNVVPFDGGDTPNAGNLINQVIPDEFAEFAIDYGCEQAPMEMVLTDEVVRYDYLGCADDVPLVFFEIVGGGHTWPGSPSGPAVANEFGATTTDINATETSWAFLSQFSLAS